MNNLEKLVFDLTIFYEDCVKDYFVVRLDESGDFPIEGILSDRDNLPVFAATGYGMPSDEIWRVIADYFSVPVYIEAKHPMLFCLDETLDKVKRRLSLLKTRRGIDNESILMVSDSIVGKKFSQYTLADYQLLYLVLSEVF